MYAAFKLVEPFVNFTVFEEAAPISTMETAFALIMLDYNEVAARESKGELPDSPGG